MCILGDSSSPSTTHCAFALLCTAVPYRYVYGILIRIYRLYGIHTILVYVYIYVLDALDAMGLKHFTPSYYIIIGLPVLRD